MTEKYEYAILVRENALIRTNFCLTGVGIEKHATAVGGHASVTAQQVPTQRLP